MAVGDGVDASELTDRELVWRRILNPVKTLSACCFFHVSRVDL